MDHQPSTGLWTGMYLASQAFRYAVTGEPEAQANAAVAVAGLHDLRMVTGIPGTYGRAYQRPEQEFAYSYDASGKGSWVASPAPGSEGWWYNHEVSKDTMDGIVFGYAVALEHLDDPALRAQITEDLLGFVQPFVAQGPIILGEEGVPTEHGKLFYGMLDDFPGFNALLSLAWNRTAISVVDDPGLTHFYDDCLLRLGDRSDCPTLDPIDAGWYLDVIEDWLHVYRPGCLTSYDNIDMVFHAIYPLLRREACADLRQRLLAVLDVGIWQPAADTQEEVCKNRLDDSNAGEVIPLLERNFDNYIWRLDPYEIPVQHAVVPGLVYSPEDYLPAYWAGRYHGFIPADL